MSEPTEVTILDAGESCPELPIVEGPGIARAVVWPGTGARLRSMHTIDLREGGRTIRLTHPMEAAYYVIEGTATVLDPNSGESFPLATGSMVHIEPGTAYRFQADLGGVRIVGGPCPPDPELYRHLSTVEAVAGQDQGEG